VAALAAGLLCLAPAARARSTPEVQAVVPVGQLPQEAQRTLALIKRGGPFRFTKDGSVFGNLERILPRRPRGYYTEYTVRTPGRRDRGARRIIAGKGATGDPASSGEYWYTADHYRSFARIEE
jgi:ribonuclease T1